MFDWEARLKTLPTCAGVYLMKNKEGEVLYVGKAKNLKQRVRQYFQKSGDNRPFVRKLPKLLGSIDVLLTHTEKEALLLEANLIQKNQPRFNILLKEQRNYLYIRLDLSKSYPRLEVIRRSPRETAPKSSVRLFGPYRSGYAVRESMSVVERYFRLRTCDERAFKNRTRPCLEYQIKRCDAPCCLPVPKDSYRAHMDEVILFLEGKHQELLTHLTEKMWAAADEHAYELAAHYRDQSEAIRKILEQQQAIQSEDQTDLDIYGFYREGAQVEFQLLTMRQGRLSGGRAFSFDDQEFSDSEVVERFLGAYYLREGIEVPQEVLLPCKIEGMDELASLLSERSGRAVRLRVPKRGDRARLVELANKNAEQGFLEKQRTEEESQKRLKKLQKRLGLSRLPFRIECVDNSHMQGRAAVSAIVVFEGGYRNRSAYRRYHLKNVAPGDDYGGMKEILTRRFKRGLKEGNLPDLLLVDGGRGQLKTAQAVLQDLELDGVEIAAIAKKRLNVAKDEKEAPKLVDRIFLLDRKDPIPVRPQHPELLLLSQLRDEAHKTAITFHKKVRERTKMQSVLDQIPTIGQTRKKALLKGLGSVKRVREASKEELLAIDGINEASADAICKFFASSASVQPHPSRPKQNKSSARKRPIQQKN